MRSDAFCHRGLQLSRAQPLRWSPHVSLVLKASCLYFVNFSSRFVAIFCCCGQAISQIQIFFFSLSSNIRSGLLTVVVFRKLNSKSQTSFLCSFSNTAPHSHRSLYHITLLPVISYSLAQLTAMIINALLCRARYSLFARTLHPATICSTASSLSRYTLHCLSWANPLDTFRDFVSTICSSIVMIDDVFRPCKFWFNHE